MFSNTNHKLRRLAATGFCLLLIVAAATGCREPASQPELFPGIPNSAVEEALRSLAASGFGF